MITSSSSSSSSGSNNSNIINIASSNNNILLGGSGGNISKQMSHNSIITSSGSHFHNNGSNSLNSSSSKNNNNNNNINTTHSINSNTVNESLILIDNSMIECCICFTTQFNKSYSCDFCDFWTCESCLSLSVSKFCPKCKRTWPKIPRRNYIIERLSEEAKQTCSNFHNGCTQLFRLKDDDHNMSGISGSSGGGTSGATTSSLSNKETSSLIISANKKKLHESELCQYRKVSCPLHRILGCQLDTTVSPEGMENHFVNHHRLDTVYLHDQERETEFFRMTMMSPLPKGTETSCLLLKQEGHTIVFVSTGEGFFRSFLFLFVTSPPRRYQIRVYGPSSAVIKINDKPQIWADICDSLPLVSFTISQQQYLKWSHANTNRSFCILLKVAEDEDEEDEEDDEEDDDEEDEEDDEDDEDEKSEDSGGDDKRFLKKLKVK